LGSGLQLLKWEASHLYSGDLPRIYSEALLISGHSDILMSESVEGNCIMNLSKEAIPDQTVWVALINDLRYTPSVLVDSAFTAENLAQERVDALNRERTLPGFIRSAEIVSIPLFSSPYPTTGKEEEIDFYGNG
jgi:hypothetical protein